MVNIPSKMKEEAEGLVELLSKKIDPEDLKPGDHIYSHKRYGSYSHHGIYVGEGFVIHFTRTEPKEGKVIPWPKSQPSVDRPPCPVCMYDEKKDFGVVRTCLDCFRRGKEKLHSIRYYAYGVPGPVHLLKKSGTCTRLVSSRTVDEVVGEAYELFWKNGFGEYDLPQNNCEHFATYCKTGQKHCEQMLFYINGKEWLKKQVG